MDNIIFREATERDLPTILKLLYLGAADPRVAAQPDPNSKSVLSAFAEIRRDENNAVYVAETGGMVVGTMQITFVPGLIRDGQLRGMLESVHIHPDTRGTGVGSAFVTWAIEKCRQRGCGLIQLSSSKSRVDAHRFYQRLGFAQSHEGFKLTLS